MPHVSIEDYDNGYSRVIINYEPIRGFTTDFQYWPEDDYPPTSEDAYRQLIARANTRRSANIVLGQSLTQEHFQQMINSLRDMDTARSALGVPYEINKMPEGGPWVLNRTGRNPRESKKEFTGDIEFDVYAE